MDPTHGPVAKRKEYVENENGRFCIVGLLEEELLELYYAHGFKDEYTDLVKKLEKERTKKVIYKSKEIIKTMLKMGSEENYEDVSEETKQKIKDILLKRDKSGKMVLNTAGCYNDFFSGGESDTVEYRKLLSRIFTQKEKQNIILERFSNIQKLSGIEGVFELDKVTSAITALFPTKTEVAEWITFLEGKQNYGLLEMMAAEFSYSQKYFDEGEKVNGITKKGVYTYVGYELQERVAKILIDYYNTQGIDMNGNAKFDKPKICRRYLGDIKPKERGVITLKDIEVAINRNKERGK